MHQTILTLLSFAFLYMSAMLVFKGAKAIKHGRGDMTLCAFLWSLCGAGLVLEITYWLA